MKKNISAKDYSKMALASYSNPNYSKDNSGYNLPPGWSFLKAFSISDSEHDGYFGVAFIKDHHAVIAHRGTNIDFSFEHLESNDIASLLNIYKDLISNLKLWSTQLPTQLDSALAFAEPICQKYQCSFTGHSLGGVLAQLTSVKLGVHATTFDSPGTREIIINNKFNFRAIDLTEYCSYPNIINSVNTHLTTPIILPDLLPTHKTNGVKGFIKATLSMHNMTAISENLSCNSSKTESLVDKTKWPLGLIATYRFHFSYDKNKLFWQKILKQNWQQDDALKQEYKTLTNYTNNYVKSHLYSKENDPLLNFFKRSKSTYESSSLSKTFKYHGLSLFDMLFADNIYQKSLDFLDKLGLIGDNDGEL